jgi:hypothetical protein
MDTEKRKIKFGFFKERIQVESFFFISFFLFSAFGRAAPQVQTALAPPQRTQAICTADSVSSAAPLQLPANQGGEHAPCGDQLVVRPCLGDDSLRDQHDAVRLADARQPVRDDQRRPPSGGVAQRVDDLGLRGRVERRGGLVEDQNRRIADLF